MEIGQNENGHKTSKKM